ncbi:iron complex outermembrane receptor protein [Pelomonas saccharophila]|uniref:Iron complex outermembrane receptor protein n=1 Tax=Roseateles saccharophilus TaxID=304 RepID=A0ABU1YGX6_ROSSA|nr:TonB-dependent receptor [Roseateles saccharophilus]MDR7268109.1 iron complex outermembrane receptor protein [Roseateles saccharophilus]
MFRKTIITSAVLALAATSALAQDAQKLERIEITGSSIKRIDAETAVPLTIVTRESIDKSGASNVQELVDRLSSNNGGGRSLGESIGDSNATGQTGASLRGLGRERTLVLLNGRRLAIYPFAGAGVDLNAIPLAAIERIEILRDGASSTYGSDAIGGVINFITRKDFRGGEVTAGYEQPQATGGTVVSAQGGIGFGDLAKDKFNILGTFSFQEYDVVHAADREFAKTGNRPDIGVVKSSGNTFPANAYNAQTGAYIPGVAGFPNCKPPDSFPGGANCRYDYTSKIDIIPASNRFGGLLRGTAELSADHLLFAELSYSRNEITLGSSQTPSSTTGRDDYLYPAGGKYYPTAAVDASSSKGYRGDLVIAWRMVDGGQRLTKVTNDMTRALVGAEGNFAGWDYKAGLMRASSKASEDFLTGNFSDTQLVRVLKTGNVNPFGPNDATGLALLKEAELHGNNRASKTTLDAFDFSMSRELFAMSGGNAAMAAGLDIRKEEYLDGYSDIAGSGDIVGGSGNAGKVRGERKTTGIYAELNLPVIKNLELNAAVRADRYSGASGESRDGAFSSPNLSSTSPKFSLRWTPMKELLVRGSVGKGFRAPALDNLYAPSAGTNTGGNFTDPYYNTLKGCAAFPNTNYCDTQLTVVNNSNRNLKPEKSKTATLGVVFEPIRDLSMEVGYFNIKITDGIKSLTGDDILKDWFSHQTGPTTSSSVYANRLIKNAQGYLDHVEASLENVGQAKVSGFDLSARYRVRTALGNFTPYWEATIVTKSSETNVVTGEVEDTLGKYLRGGPVVRVKQNVSLDWDTDAWAGGVRYFRQSGYRDYDEVRHVPKYDLWSLQGQYKGVKNLVLTAGVLNLLDKKPPVTVQEDYFQVGFDPTYADVKGRSFYVRANYKF